MKNDFDVTEERGTIKVSFRSQAHEREIPSLIRKILGIPDMLSTLRLLLTCEQNSPNPDKDKIGLIDTTIRLYDSAA